MDLPFEEGTFEAYIGHLVWHIAPDSGKAIEEAFRVTASGGRVGAVIPGPKDESIMRTLLKEVFIKAGLETPSMVEMMNKDFDPDLYIGKMKEVGFTNVKLMKYPISFYGNRDDMLNFITIFAAKDFNNLSDEDRQKVEKSFDEIYQERFSELRMLDMSVIGMIATKP